MLETQVNKTLFAFLAAADEFSRFSKFQKIKSVNTYIFTMILKNETCENVSAPCFIYLQLLLTFSFSKKNFDTPTSLLNRESISDILVRILKIK